MFFSKLEFKHESWIGLSQDSVSIARDYFTSFQRVGDVRLNIFFSPVFAELLFEVQDETEALLVGKTMERASESIHACGERQVGITQS